MGKNDENYRKMLTKYDQSNWEFSGFSCLQENTYILRNSTNACTLG